MSLDPRTTRQERETEKARKQQALSLNPPFPHKRQPFDPFFFSLERETPDEEAARALTSRGRRE